MASDSVTRLNCEIPDAVNEKLNELIPHGSKSDVIRKLVDIYIEAASRDGRQVVIFLLDGHMELRRKPSVGT